ncbi:GNAT family N-acetyltransferase [Luedemannella flava]|uniref:GNAT family N-acetyltransferase n=1 Tax=Luedemannella flava TaxID=349316 RepID=A0ABP4YKU7_9ACTN
MATEIIHNEDASRYEIHVDGHLAGYVLYRTRPDALALVHTTVLPEFEGRGLGSTLARGVLDTIRAHKGLIVPLCPFIAAFIKRHPDYTDLIVPRYHEEQAASAGDGA